MFNIISLSPIGVQLYILFSDDSHVKADIQHDRLMFCLNSCIVQEKKILKNLNLQEQQTPCRPQNVNTKVFIYIFFVWVTFLNEYNVQSVVTTDTLIIFYRNLTCHNVFADLGGHQIVCEKGCCQFTATLTRVQHAFSEAYTAKSV